jgi:hypothetical protein
VGGRQVRLYEWVSLAAEDRQMDPALVGSVVGAMHRVRMPADGPPDPWYTAPVGADAWDRLIVRLRAAGAPFAERLASLRNELVALESWLQPPATQRLPGRASSRC